MDFHIDLESIGGSNKLVATVICTLLTACAGPGTVYQSEGLVEYAGAQKDIFTTGIAAPVVKVAELVGGNHAFGVGAVAGLDGEVTVMDGKPYITKVRGGGYTVEHDPAQGLVFAVWSRQPAWQEESVPSAVRGYVDLQQFVRARAASAGIDVGKPFPFRLAGAPAEVKWHFNVDLTGGQRITPELFAQSKANYVARNEPMDIIGFYSESHPGVFISAYAPAIRADSGVKNAIHIHLVSRDGKSAGHIDDLILAPGTVLFLPREQ